MNGWLLVLMEAPGDQPGPAPTAAAGPGWVHGFARVAPPAIATPRTFVAVQPGHSEYPR